MGDLLRGSVIVGDIGGTNARFAVARAALPMKLQNLHHFKTHDFSSLNEVLEKYISEQKLIKLRKIILGVAGPVIENRCETINLPWSIDGRQIKKQFPKTDVILVNDVYAAAIGLKNQRKAAKLKLIWSPKAFKSSKQSPIALLAPGTGLGEAIIADTVLPSEGGHADFGPQNDDQIELLRWMWQRHKHVSVEHLCSGPGLFRIYRFLVETGRETEPKALAHKVRASGVDPSSEISNNVLSENPHPLCTQAIDIWLFCLGAEAGNLALKSLSFGGVVLGGGIIRKILPLLSRPAFLEGFLKKGRMENLVRLIPISAMTERDVPLYGSAAIAFDLER